MSLPVNERPLCFRISSELYTAVWESIGAASMCWNPSTPEFKGEFDSNKASQVATDLCFKIAEAMENQADLSASDEIETALDKFAEAGAKAWTDVEPRSLRGELVWSKEKPTGPGWYFRRLPHVRPIEVVQIGGVWGGQNHWGEPLSKYQGGEWAGPINPPAEPNL